MQAFKVGEVVKLKARVAGPVMTIALLDGDGRKVTCIWWKKEACEFGEYVFDVELLEAVVSEPKTAESAEHSRQRERDPWITGRDRDRFSF